MPKNLPITGNRAECTVCGECFNSDHAFDSHRVGASGSAHTSRRCLTEPEMLVKGFGTNRQGYWIRSTRPAGTTPTSATSNALPAHGAIAQ